MGPLTTLTPGLQTNNGMAPGFKGVPNPEQLLAALQHPADGSAISPEALGAMTENPNAYSGAGTDARYVRAAVDPNDPEAADNIPLPMPGMPGGMASDKQMLSMAINGTPQDQADRALLNGNSNLDNADAKLMMGGDPGNWFNQVGGATPPPTLGLMPGGQALIPQTLNI